MLTYAPGCGFDPACGLDAAARPTIVLTFDDGPIAADLPHPAAADPDELLRPLNEILAVLERRGIQAVFFVRGPGDDSSGQALAPAAAAGVAAMHDAGHVLGYHGYRHVPELWVQPLTPVSLASAEMAADLDQLAVWLDGLCASQGLEREQVFAPLFRQPYGGGGVSRVAAWTAAAQRGWTYRGFLVDSVDWLDNADSDPQWRERLHVSTDTDYVAFVRERLRAGLAANGHRPVIDVLLHVNGFTAAHLDDWIDELNGACLDSFGGLPSFTVPTCYLEQDDPEVDLSVIEQLLGAP